MDKPAGSGAADIDSGFLVRMCRRVLRPIIGILIRSGMPFAQFSEIARTTYVEVASEEFGIRGRRTNTSRIALLTGLSRAQAKRELDRLRRDDDSDASQTSTDGLEKVRHVSRLLLGWHTDTRFLDGRGQPIAIPVKGKDASFQTLYDEYSGKVVPATSMLKELINVGAVTGSDDGLLRVHARSYTPERSDRAALHRIFLAMSDLAGSARHNLFRNENERARFERFATNQLIPESELDNFRDFLEAEGQAFLERADDWLTRRESHDGLEKLIRIGVGVYQVCSPPVVSPDAPEARPTTGEPDEEKN